MNNRTHSILVTRDTFLDIRATQQFTFDSVNQPLNGWNINFWQNSYRTGVVSSN